MLMLAIVWLLGGVIAYFVIGYLAVAANNRFGQGAALSVLGCAYFMLQVVIALLVTATAYYSLSHVTGVCAGIISIIVIARNTWNSFR